MTEADNKKIDNIEKLVGVIATNVLKLTEDMTEVKKDIGILKTDVTILKTDVAQIKTDLDGFKTETRESFDRLEKSIKENEENTEAIVGNYHPHIIALEEKVFGQSTLAEI